MPQIINEPTLGGQIGQAFGTGLGSALQSLALNKMQQLQQRQMQNKTAVGFEALGIPKDKSQQLSLLPESLQSLYVKQHLQAPQAQNYAAVLQSILGGGQTPSNINIPAGVNPQQAYQLTNLALQEKQRQQQSEFQREKLNLQKQQQGAQISQKATEQELRKKENINKHNAPYNKSLSEKVDTNTEIYNLAKRSLDLFNTREVSSGFKGSLVSGLGNLPVGIGKAVGPSARALFLNPESQEFEANVTKLATLKASEKGTSSDLRVSLEQLSKPSIAQDQKAQENLLKKIINDSQKVLLEGRIRDYIIDKNHGEETKNLEIEVGKKLKAASKLPNPIEYENGTIWNIGKDYYVLENDQWFPYDQENEGAF